MKKLFLIVAFDDNFGVGLNNSLPWHFSEDLKHFKNMTLNKNLIMGRKTFDSLPGVLPGRVHIVLTNEKGLTHSNKNVFYANSIEECFEISSKLNDLDNIVIGGSKIWDLFMPLADTLYVTKISGTYDVDTYFNKDNLESFKPEKSVSLSDECNFITYQRSNAKDNEIK